MRRYWIEKKDIHDLTVTFAGEVFHHIFDVCRQEAGSKFEVLNEDGKAYFVQVTNVEKKSATAKILEERIVPPIPQPHLHLALSISRFPVMDAVVEKAVEMGVKSILPFFSDFSFLRKENSLSENKIERWHKIIRSATQQSGRGDLMTLHQPIDITKLHTKINQTKDQLGLFAYEGASTLGIKDYLKNFKGQQNSKLTDIWLIVGSEGGFSPNEVEDLQKLGLRPVTLGSQILRVETACMTLVSVLKYEFDLMK